MCTVTLFPTPETDEAPRRGFRMVCNRDEQHTRAPARPPEPPEPPESPEPPEPPEAALDPGANHQPRILHPTDPAGGGTWVGVNEHGVAATLLNLNLPEPPERRDDHQSRGLLVLSALTHPTAQAAAASLLAQTGPNTTLPFRLITADTATGVHLVRCDGQRITHEALGPIDQRYFFTSSGLGDHHVEGPRKQLFEDTFAALNDAEAYEQQLAFHHHQWPEQKHLSIDTMREDARTVSRTEVTVGDHAIRMAYTPTQRDGTPGQTTAATLALADPPSEPQETQAKAPSKWWTWKTYLVLLLLSAVFQSFVTLWPVWPSRPYPHVDNMQIRRVEVDRMSATGPVDGPPVTIEYRHYGPPDAPITLVALHGSPNAGPNFFRFGPRFVDAMAELGQSVRVIAPDLPGYGHSSRWVPDYGCDAYAHYTLALMDALDIQTAHVLGYSLGGGVATRMIDLSPERLESVVFFGGIGDQSVEGTGDYGFEHFKYGVAYAVFVVGPELLPHFGLLGDRAMRHAFARNFWDTDQRPYAKILASTPPQIPMLFINGADDPLVPADAARRHHTLVKHSELKILPGGHGDIFREGRVQPVVDAIANFIHRKTALNEPAMRRTSDPVDPGQAFAERQIEALTEPLKLKDTASPWLKLLLIAAGTFVSEDYTCIAVGLLINYGHTDLFLGVLACFLGIFIGDIGLFLLGRLAGRRVLGWGPIKKWAPSDKLEDIGQWYRKYGFVAVFASRFMPGTRFPLYVTAGVVGKDATRFVIWAAISDIIYTPLVVILVATFGDRLAEPLTTYFGHGWITLLLTAACLFIALKFALGFLSPAGRRKWRIRLAKTRHHEWWPAKYFYLPMVPVWLYLIVRYRSFTCWTAANPAIPDGGIVGESKADILSALPPEAVIPWALLKQDTNDTRMDQFREALAARCWSYPMILKPDVGERGAAVRKVNNDDQAAAYFNDIPGDIIAQVFDEGPHECGIFYVRPPDEAAEAGNGYIFAITDKTFPELSGDGEHTVEQLIHQHPRYRMQADVFLSRLHDRRNTVLADGETIGLTLAGNHSQGCMFTDGAHLYTDALTRAIDQIAVGYKGFGFGRFDIRYSDPHKLREGQDLRIVELNGVTSEATNLYDPSWSALRAYQQLAAQWDWCFKIGRANVDQGVPATRVRTLLGILLSRFRVKPDPIAG